MHKARIRTYIGVLGLGLAATGCKTPALTQRSENRTVPATFGSTGDTTQQKLLSWREFFKDPYLVSLIDTALQNNQELMITLQDIEIARNDIRARKAALLPSVGIRAGAGFEKAGRYTSKGASEASSEIEEGREVPEPLPDYGAALYAHWEIDIWKKLRNARKAAVARYVATVEGKNFVLTNLVAEVAASYYELLALDNQLEIVRQNIELQKSALDIVKLQKEASRATELAVQKFQAEVLKSQSLEFDILQQIREAENRINFLLGRYPQDIPREKNNFLDLLPAAVSAGIPAQLLANRPDIKRAEQELTASKLDVKVARAEFYPSLDITAALGLQAFKPGYLVKLPQSLLYSLAGDLAGPLINRNAIKAEFYSANARQLQAMYNYERVLLNAYLEVATELSRISNLEKSYNLKSRQVAALTRSIEVSNDLYRSARADYLEVLMTQRDALESKLELIETKKAQLNAAVHVYRDLGGGWQ